jgi:hypothetical protein
VKTYVAICATLGRVCSLAIAQAWVNKGLQGTGVVGLNPWLYPTVTGNFTITASQT